MSSSSSVVREPRSVRRKGGKAKTRKKEERKGLPGCLKPLSPHPIHGSEKGREKS